MADAQVGQSPRTLLFDRQLRWTGLSARSGKLFDEPALTDDGVVVPLLRKGKLELATIADRDLGPCLGIPGVF